MNGQMRWLTAWTAACPLYTSSKAEKAMEALQSMSSPHARVIRDGKEVVIDAVQVVPGDIILVEAGDNIDVYKRQDTYRDVK